MDRDELRQIAFPYFTGEPGAPWASEPPVIVDLEPWADVVARLWPDPEDQLPAWPDE